MTFRVGLFGLDKWHNVDRTVAQLAAALDHIGLAAHRRQAASRPDRDGLTSRRSAPACAFPCAPFGGAR